MYSNENKRAIKTNDFGNNTADFIKKFWSSSEEKNNTTKYSDSTSNNTSSMTTSRVGNAYQSPKNMSSEDIVASEDRKRTANANVMNLFNRMNEEKKSIDEQQALDRQSRMVDTSISFYSHWAAVDNEDLSNEYSYYGRLNEIWALIMEKNKSDDILTPSWNVEDIVWDYIERKDSQGVYDAINDYLHNPSADKQSDLEKSYLYEKTLEDRIVNTFDAVKNFAWRVVNKVWYGMELAAQWLDWLMYDVESWLLDFADWTWLMSDENVDKTRAWIDNEYAMSTAIRSYDRFWWLWTENDWKRLEAQLEENPNMLEQYAEESNILNNLVKTGFWGLFSAFQATSVVANMFAWAISVATEIPVVEKLMSLWFVELPKMIVDTWLSYVKPLYKLWNTLDNESKNVLMWYISGKYSVKALKWATWAKTTQELVEDIKSTFNTAFKDARNWLKFKKWEKISDKTSEQKTSMKKWLTEWDKVKAKRALLEKILWKTITKNLNDNTANKLMRSLDEVENRSEKDIEKLIEEKEAQKQSKLDSEDKLLDMDKKLYKQSDILESTKTDNMPKWYDFVWNLLKGLKEIYKKMTPETDVINWEEYPFITDDIKFVDDMLTKYGNEWLSRTDINNILRKTSSAVNTYNNKVWSKKNWTPLEWEAALESLRKAGKDFVNKWLDEYLQWTKDAFDLLDEWISDDIKLIDHLQQRQWELRWEYATQKYQWNPEKFTTKIKKMIKKVRPLKSSSKMWLAWKILEQVADLWDLNIIELNKLLPKIWEAYASLNEWNPSRVKAIQNKINDIIKTTDEMIRVADIDSKISVLDEQVSRMWDWTVQKPSKKNTNNQQPLFDAGKEMDYFRWLQDKFRQDFIDLLKEWGATDEWLAEAADFIQNELFDL